MPRRKSRADVDPANRSSGEHAVEQCGAICWRASDTGGIEVLLVTSRDTRRWVIPKGNVEKHEAQFRCAQREAREEAGVIGKVAKTPVGRYAYFKDADRPVLEVAVYPLHVDIELDTFREVKQRERQWFAVDEAASLVDEPDLREILLLIAGENMPKVFRKALQKIVGRESERGLAA